MRGVIQSMALMATLGSAASADFIYKDALTKDTGWTSWDSKTDFTDNGLSTLGVISQELKWLPDAFSAHVTLDTKGSIIWGFGVAASYSPDSGFSGLALVADRSDKPVLTLGRWESDKLVDGVTFTPDDLALFEGTHDLVINVTNEIAWAQVDGKTYGKIAYGGKPAGTQVVLASYAENDAYFRDMSLVLIPSQSGFMALAPLVMLAAYRRRRG
ncbi:MAG: hypothetical protein U0570_08885 [Phycisphaerales bacterium]